MEIAAASLRRVLYQAAAQPSRAAFDGKGVRLKGR